MLRVAMLCILSLWVASPSGQAQDGDLVSASVGRVVAENWLHVMSRNASDSGGGALDIRALEPIEVNGETLAWNCRLRPQGHILVSALRTLPPIIAYSTRSDLATDGPPCRRHGILELIEARLGQERAGLRSGRPGQAETDARVHALWQLLGQDAAGFAAALQGRDQEVRTQWGPLLTSCWNQDWPFNNECPLGDMECTECAGSPPHDPTYPTLAGCVAIAVAQIMNYHEWPPHGIGSYGYFWDGDDSCDHEPVSQWLGVDLSDAYAWDLMPDYASVSTPEQQEAVAELCYEVGVACEMDYGVCGSGTQTDEVLRALPELFRYQDTLEHILRGIYPSGAWFALLADEIAAGRPVYYTILTEESAHALVCDGVSDELGGLQMHVNYGAGCTQYYGWCDLDALPLSYDLSGECIVRGIAPETGQPGLVADYEFYEASGDTLHDTSGHGNHGVIHGAVWDFGPGAQQSLWFDGVDDYVLVPDSPDLHLGSGTIEISFWLPESRGPGSPSMELLHKEVGGETEGDLQIYFAAGDGKLYVEAETEHDRYTVESDSGNWEPGAHHLAYVFDGSGMRLYVDHELQADVNPFAASLSSNTRDLVFGYNLSQGAEAFRGGLGAIRISSVVLGPDDFLAPAAWAPVIWVSPLGIGYFGTIQTALDYASPGTDVLLADGTYTGPGNRDLDFAGKEVTVSSEGGIAVHCLIDCEASAADPHRGALFTQGEGSGSGLANVTIQNAYEAENGAGIFISGGSPTLQGVRLVSNEAGSRGGGIYCVSGSPSIENCVFIENHAASLGGGLAFEEGTSVLTSCVFFRNTSGFRGGAVSCLLAVLAMEDSDYIENMAAGDGGGLFANACQLDLDHCWFEENSTNPGGTGGGIYCTGDSAQLAYCTIVGNAAGTAGGIRLSENEMTITYSTLAYNAAGAGGAIYGHDGTLDLRNTIVAFSTDGAAVAGSGSLTATLECCDLFGNAGGDWVGPVAGQDGSAHHNIALDPQFCDAANGDYTLWSCSPCLGAACGQIGAWGQGCADPQGVPLDPDEQRWLAAEPGIYCSPNPTRGAVSIRLVRSPSDRKGAARPHVMRIFDVTGSVIAELARPTEAARAVRFEWDRRDAAGRELPAGVYWIRARGAGATGTARLVVLR